MSSNSAGDQEALELSATQLVGKLVQYVRGIEAHCPQGPLHFIGPLPKAHFRVELVVNHPENPVCLEDGVERGEGILENALDFPVVLFEGRALQSGNVCALKPDRAGRDGDEAEDKFPDCAFAASAFADEGNDLPLTDFKTDVADRDQFLEAEGAEPVDFGDPFQRQHQ